MAKNPSLFNRIAIGKIIGFIIGLIGFICLPILAPEPSTLMLRFGVLLWYTTVGAVIGVFGVLTYHPVLKLPLPWWFRAPFIGAWMNFVLALIAYDKMQAVIIAVMGEGYSPFWFSLEGAVVGLIIGYFATRFGGEGKETVG